MKHLIPEERWKRRLLAEEAVAGLLDVCVSKLGLTMKDIKAVLIDLLDTIDSKILEKKVKR